ADRIGKMSLSLLSPFGLIIQLEDRYVSKVFGGDHMPMAAIQQCLRRIRTILQDEPDGFSRIEGQRKRQRGAIEAKPRNVRAMNVIIVKENRQLAVDRRDVAGA